MSHKKLLGGLVMVAACIVVLSERVAQAARMQVTNVAVVTGGNLQFDIAWEDSWRASWKEGDTEWTNWDAAWIFVKYRKQGAPGWSHATLSVNDADHAAPESNRRGRITRCGNRWVRTLLVESAWHHRFPPKMSRQLRARNQGVAPDVQRIAWKAQHRLHKRLYRLTARGKRPQQAVVAIARELAGFVWAVGQEEELLAETT